MKTKVLFLIDNEEIRNGEHPHEIDVFAVFPDMPENKEGTKLLCYSQIGQHSAVNLSYIKTCNPATPVQYKTLLNELTALGYEVDIIDKPA